MGRAGGIILKLLGFVLLTAAALKGHELATSPIVETSLWTSRWFLIAVVEFELLLGVWLLSGVYPKQAWCVALPTFLLYAVVSLFKALAGEASCGCFGKLPLAPWYAFAFNLASVTALWFWKQGPAPNIRSHPLRFSLVTMLVVLLGPLGLMVMSGYRAPLSLSAEYIDLGIVPRAGYTWREFWITNVTDQTVNLAGVETSCPCLDVEFSCPSLPAGEKMKCVLLADFSKEPDYVGDLKMSVIGRSADGTVAFRMVCWARVTSGYPTMGSLKPLKEEVSP